LEGLLAASAHGLAHGSLLPSQMVCDALGRPLLGPFGTYHLAGLAATRTGTLEELLRLSAPELRGGGSPTTAGDVFALGVVMQALLRGSLDPDEQPLPPGPEADLAARMAAVEPELRPLAEDVLQELTAPVADTREVSLGRAEDSGQAWQTLDPGEPDPAQGIVVSPASSWTDEQLDALCEDATPWMQPIVDRDERRFVLAPWPPGSKVLDAQSDDYRELVPAEAFSELREPVRDAIQARLRPTSLVATPSGEWMLALDDLLTR
jgi:serine/threonine protein kinase